MWYYRAMELLTVEEVAATLKLSPYTIRRLLKEGKLPGVKVGGGQQWRVRKSDLDAYLGNTPKPPNTSYPTTEGRAPQYIHEPVRPGDPPPDPPTESPGSILARKRMERPLYGKWSAGDGNIAED